MDLQVSERTLGFVIPTFGEMLTFLVKGFFVVAGIATLIMLLWGALAWVLSGGDKENVEKARDRMVAALMGLFLILVALSTVWTLEQIVFRRTVCFGLSCPVTIPSLLNSSGSRSSTGTNGTNSNSSHIFARPTARPVTTGTGAQGSGASGTNSTGTQGSTLPTPTGLQNLPGTGL